MKASELLSEIDALEQELAEKKNRLMRLRKSVPRNEVNNYVFRDSTNNEISLQELFGDKNELIVVQNMGKSCSYCTMWADGFNGVYHHIIEKAAFVVATPDSPAIQDAFAAERRWQFPMISTNGTTFKEDLGFEKNGNQHPGVSTFQRDEEGRMYHVANAPFGPGDDFCSVWYLFDLLPSGSTGFHPKRAMTKNAEYHLTNNIAVQVKNKQEAVHFYTNILGMKQVQESTQETKLLFGGHHFYVEESNDLNVYFEFATKDVEKSRLELLDNGCTITKQFSDKSMMIQDPYGMNFHLFERA
jgi:predicted dithiol-disulfide oxidoreductase (DUF899 family)